MPGVTYDPEGDVLYVRLTEAPVSKSVSLDDVRIIDHSEDGRVVGIEFIGASGGVDLRSVPFAHRVEEMIRENGLEIPVFA